MAGFGAPRRGRLCAPYDIIERSFKMLGAGGRMAIILPEGYLSTPVYGYVRQWIVDNLRLLSLVELPRRIFIKSDADLRSNIVIGQKLPKAALKRMIDRDYPIHADLVRKPGFVTARTLAPTYMRDQETGIELRDENNKRLIDSDFTRARTGFEKLLAVCSFNAHKEPSDDTTWGGARIRDVLDHANLDMKPRRLTSRAMQNLHTIKAGKFITLKEIADVVKNMTAVMKDGPSKLWRLVRGLDIRAIEGVVTPEAPARAWELADREPMAYELKNGDIIVGLVRPERRNIGMLLDYGNDIAGSPDGIGVVRVKQDKLAEYPQEWLFAAMRSETSRIQLWTESGGTSYGKLTNGHLLNLLLPVPSDDEIQETANKIRTWATELMESNEAWQSVGSPEDRRPIINSAAHGLMEDDAD